MYVPAKKTRSIDFCCPDLFEARTRFFLSLSLSLSLELTPALTLTVSCDALPWDMTSKAAAAADGKRGRGRVTKLLLPVGTTKRETVARATGRAN